MKIANTRSISIFCLLVASGVTFSCAEEDTPQPQQNNAQATPDKELNCVDGIDNDADGLLDCRDPECFGAPICNFTTGGNDSNDNNTSNNNPDSENKEICGDSQDNDGDGLTDCADPECSSEPVCKTEDCTDEEDNDNDGLIDCEDFEDCGDTLACDESIGECGAPEDCAGSRNAGCWECIDFECVPSNSGLTCGDTGVCLDGACLESEICDDFEDNDGDGLTDCDDRDCADECQDLICDSGELRCGESCETCPSNAASVQCSPAGACLATSCENGFSLQNDGTCSARGDVRPAGGCFDDEICYDFSVQAPGAGRGICLSQEREYSTACEDSSACPSGFVCGFDPFTGRQGVCVPACDTSAPTRSQCEALAEKTGNCIDSDNLCSAYPGDTALADNYCGGQMSSEHIWLATQSLFAQSFTCGEDAPIDLYADTTCANGLLGDNWGCSCRYQGCDSVAGNNVDCFTVGINYGGQSVPFSGCLAEVEDGLQLAGESCASDLADGFPCTDSSGSIGFCLGGVCTIECGASFETEPLSCDSDELQCGDRCSPCPPNGANPVCDIAGSCVGTECAAGYIDTVAGCQLPCPDGQVHLVDGFGGVDCGVPSSCSDFLPGSEQGEFECLGLQISQSETIEQCGVNSPEGAFLAAFERCPAGSTQFDSCVTLGLPGTCIDLGQSASELWCAADCP